MRAWRTSSSRSRDAAPSGVVWDQRTEAQRAELELLTGFMRGSVAFQEERIRRLDATRASNKT